MKLTQRTISKPGKIVGMSEDDDFSEDFLKNVFNTFSQEEKNSATYMHLDKHRIGQIVHAMAMTVISGKTFGEINALLFIASVLHEKGFNSLEINNVSFPASRSSMGQDKLSFCISRGKKQSVVNVSTPEKQETNETITDHLSDGDGFTAPVIRSYLQHPDFEELGKQALQAAIVLKDEKGKEAMQLLAMLLVIAEISMQYNSTSTRLKAGGVHIDGVDTGDWELSATLDFKEGFYIAEPDFSM